MNHIISKQETNQEKETSSSISVATSSTNIQQSVVNPILNEAISSNNPILSPPPLESARIYIGKHKCNVCNNTFGSSPSLSKHKSTHHRQKSFECDICHRTLKTKEGLKGHIVAFHTNDGKCKCEYCGKTFVAPNALKRHIRIHTKEKPFKCNECNRCFSTKDILKRHQRIHTGEKPYLCQECGKKFRQSGALRKHERRVHKHSAK